MPVAIKAATRKSQRVLASSPAGGDHHPARRAECVAALGASLSTTA